MTSFDHEKSEDARITGDNNNIITAICSDSCGYCTKWMSPDYIETAEYSIKVIKMKEDCGLGITTTDNPDDRGDDDNMMMMVANGETLRFNGDNLIEGKCNITFKSGDILKVKINFATKKMSLAINNNSESVLFENIAVKKSYKLTVSLPNKDDSLMIMEYKEVKQRDEQYEQEKKEMEYVRSQLEQYKNENNELTSQILKVCEENETLKSKVNDLMQQNESLKHKLEIVQDEKKEMELELKKAKMKSIDTNNWEEWSTNDVLLWILSIEDTKFSKYEEQLNVALYEQEIIGEVLPDVNENDVLGWGVKSFKDKKILLKHIKILIQSQSKNKNDEGNNVAPTAFI